MSIRFVTYSDQSIDQTLLQTSANQHKIDLSVILIEDRWVSHWQKIEYLLQFLKTQVPSNDYVCYLDAFDTIFNQSQDNIVNKFESLEKDLIFGSEANYSMSIKSQIGPYLEKYPTVDPLYNYLNAGTFMGKKESIITFIESVLNYFKIQLPDQHLYSSGEDDQSYFNIFFVEYTLGNVDSPISIGLDNRQILFGCTGGRVAAIPETFASVPLQFIYYKKERSVLKRSGLLHLQRFFLDLVHDDDSFFNKKTNERPVIIHSPGSGSNFRAIVSFNRETKAEFSNLFDRSSLFAKLKTYWTFLKLKIKHPFESNLIRFYYSYK
ncbi:MAG: glycosyltransferase domain-containing protein [Cyclobacteriaceae bacterium]